MRKYMKFVLLSLFIVSFLLTPFIFWTDSEVDLAIETNGTSFPATDYVSSNVRVAIYDEPNMTAPSYATYPGARHNNVTGLRDILLGYGYDVTLLNVQNISNYELTTADFDVLCLVDNFPRENITYRIMDFWLGGGGLLVFDGSGGFLCHFGILPPEAIGTSGNPTYWQYGGADIVFTGLHPVSKTVAPGGYINTAGGYLTWNLVSLSGSAIYPDLTRVASTTSDINEVSILAFDPTDRGGRVVTIAEDLYSEYVPELEPLYADAVDWLAPRPKARILYDLSHQPWCPTDPWEWSGDSNYLTTWRNGLVANQYTVDKLHPSAFGNLTADNLASYDMLVVNQPMVNYTAAEVAAVEQWVSDGGGLFVIGDNPGVPDNYNLDYLMATYGMQFNDTVTPYNSGVFDFDMHPTTEECLSLVYQGATNLILSGGAYPIWRYAEGEFASGASEYGDGRVLAICDANSVLDAWIGGGYNYQFAMNIANWLTSSKARVLLYHDNTGIPSYNHYRSGVADALNELGLNFMFTQTPEYFNLSMRLQDWELVISDANSRSSVSLYPLILDHLIDGGKLIMRDFFFRFRPEDYPDWDFSLFPYIGFIGAGPDERITSGAPTVYLWDEYHDVFHRPVDFAVDHFESSSNYYGTDWTNVTLLENATAIAGITPSPEVNQSAIVLGAGGLALCNMFSISQYLDDYDNSAYPDNFEIWLNEISYMMQPTIDALDDFTVEVGTPSFEWVGHSYGPSDYQIKRDQAIIVTQVWDGSPIAVDISGLSVGTYVFELMVRDKAGYRADDMVIVTIEEPSTTTTTPTSTTPTSTTPTSTTPTSTTPTLPIPQDLNMLLIIAAAAGWIVVVVLLFLVKKKS